LLAHHFVKPGKNVKKNYCFARFTLLSCYALTVGLKLTLDKLIKQKKHDVRYRKNRIEHFGLLIQWMKEADCEHYEISNFANLVLKLRHNNSY